MIQLIECNTGDSSSELNSEPSKPYRVGLDIGGTKIQGVLLDATGNTVAIETSPTVRGDEGVTSGSLALLDSLLTHANVTSSECCSIGVGIPGIVNSGSGDVKNAVNLGVEELPLGSILSSATGLPVRVDNDVNLAALGAAHALKLDGVVAYLNVGTGMAAALVVDGVLYSGTSGASGEIGHLPIDPNGTKCKCGQTGCIETVASGAAISRLWPSKQLHPSDALYQAHLSGNPQATQIFNDLADGIAQAVRALFLSFDPEIVVIGGGMRRLGEPLIEAVLDVISDWEKDSEFIASLRMRERIRIMPSGVNAGAVGAAIVPVPND